MVFLIWQRSPSKAIFVVFFFRQFMIRCLKYIIISRFLIFSYKQFTNYSSFNCNEWTLGVKVTLTLVRSNIQCVESDAYKVFTVPRLKRKLVNLFCQHDELWPKLFRWLTNCKQGSVPSSRKVSHRQWWKEAAEEVANNLWAEPGCEVKLNIATYYLRSIATKKRLKELEEELNYINWDVLGITEIRRRNEQSLELTSGNHLNYRGQTNSSVGGLCVLIMHPLGGRMTKNP